MDSSQLLDIQDELARLRDRGKQMGTYVCNLCIDLAGVTGAGVMLMSGGQHRGVLGTSDRTALTIEDLQFITGEGPCIDACRDRRPVREPDLAEPHTPRWPAFTGPALDAGVRSIFGIPLTSGRECVGVIDLYRDTAEDLSDAQIDDVTSVAALVAETVVRMQSDAPVGTLAPELQMALRYQAVIHQASGMVSAALDITVAEALVRLRAHAYAVDLPLRDLARSIVDRSFDPESMG
jgi:GAF domain-containing protein